MTPEYIENKDFKGENFTEKEFQKAEYENLYIPDIG